MRVRESKREKGEGEGEGEGGMRRDDYEGRIERERSPASRD